MNTVRSINITGLATMIIIYVPCSLGILGKGTRFGPSEH
jgi:hypothetical protein